MTLAHAKFSASGSARWIACPASITMEQPFPDVGSEYATEGSMAHWLGEQALRGGLHCSFFHGVAWPEDPSLTVAPAMAEFVQEYVDYVRSIPGELHVEQRVGFGHVVPDGFGTADAIIYDADTQTLTIVDLKYGQGVRVEAYQNTQAQLYALGTLNDFGWLGEISTVTCVIHQPRLDHVSEWSTTPEELHAFAMTARDAAMNALSDAPRFGPSEYACRFCKAAGVCKPLAQHNVGIAMKDFDEGPSLIEVNTLSREELAQALQGIKLFQTWLGALETYALGELTHGRAIPGFKLVEGRSNRQWSDERDAEVALLAELNPDDVFTRKVISPTQAEKILGKKHRIVTELVIKPAGKPTLAPESDARPALSSSAEQDFAE